MPAVQDDAISAGVAGVGRRTPVTNLPTARLVALEPPQDREQAFIKARRRSARVRWLRRAILISGLSGVAATLIVALYNPFAAKLGSLSFGALSVEGTKIVMDRPKLAGFRSDGQPYVLTAERALQDIKQPTVVQLRKVDGQIGTAGGEATYVVADTGVYDSVGEHMELADNVRIKNGRFTVFLRSARFDFKSGVYGSDDHVDVQTGDGTTIVADRASAINHGQELTFDGHVQTRIVPLASQEPPSESKRTDP